MEAAVGLPGTDEALLGGEPAAEEAGGAGVENVGVEGEGGAEEYGEEGSEEYDDEDSLSFDLPIETPKQTAPILLATSLLGAWILLLVAVGWSALKGSRKDLQSMPLDTDSLVTYRENFRESVDKLEEAWKETPDAVKLVFAKYHMPSASDSDYVKVTDAWNLMQRQIDGINRTAAPKDSASKEEKWKYAMQLHIVTSFCNSAVLRLHGLGKLVSKVQHMGLEVPWLCDDEGSSLEPPSVEETTDDGDMTYEDFLKLLPPRIQQQMEGVTVQGTISSSLGQRLASLVEAIDTFTVEGRYVAMRFDSVLDAFGVALDTVAEHDFENASPIMTPADKTPAAAKILLHFIAEQFERSTQKLVASGVAGDCAQQWDEEGVNRVIKALVQGEEQRVRELVKLKRDLVQKAVIDKPLHKGHILPLSVFLL